MRYMITLTPLEPFYFGGDVTFGKRGDKENGTYLVTSRYFPQQTALLGVLRKEMLIQEGLLTRKVRGEWVDEQLKGQAKELVGDGKFEFDREQSFGKLGSISPLFLLQNGTKFIKKVAIDSCEYHDGLLKDYNPKEDIYDNFIATDLSQNKKRSDIFKSIEQVGNSKQDSESSLFKKSSYMLLDGFKFALYIESEYALKDSIITLGGERSSFKMQVKECEKCELEHSDPKGYLTLLSDAYIDIPIKGECDFAITSEISFNYLQNSFEGNKKRFQKSPKTRFLYERGSLFINPSDILIASLNNSNLQKIGYNHFTKGEER